MIFQSNSGSRANDQPVRTGKRLAQCQRPRARLQCLGCKLSAIGTGLDMRTRRQTETEDETTQQD